MINLIEFLIPLPLPASATRRHGKPFVMECAMKKRPVLSLFVCLGLKLVTGEVFLSEVMFNPAGPEATDEFVEIYNASPADTVDLSGWKISDGTGEDRITDAGGGIRLLPQQYGLILDPDYFGRSATYDTLIPGDCLVLTLDGSTIGSSGLSNSTPETVTLIDAAGRILDTHTYDIRYAPGHSSERKWFDEPAGPGAWGQSLHLNGTPGAPNSILKYETDAALIGPIYGFSEKEAFRITAGLVNAGRTLIPWAVLHFYHDADCDGRAGPDEKIGETVLETPLAPDDTARVSLLWPGAPSGGRQIVICAEIAGDQRPENNLLAGRVTVPFPLRCLILNEIQFQPASREPEWFELYNRSTLTVDLAGWRFSDSDTIKSVVMTKTERRMAPGEFAVIASDSTLHGRLPPGGVLLVPVSFPRLNNDSDAVYIRDPTGRVIDSARFWGSWLPAPGVSLERLHPDRPSHDRDNWHGCTDLEGMTPGRENSVYIARPPAASRLCVAPNPFSPDGDGHEDVALISYRLTEAVSTIRIRIFDVLGRRVKTLRPGLQSGPQGAVLWDGTDDSGKRVQIGIYLVHLCGMGADGTSRTEHRAVLVLAGRL